MAVQENGRHQEEDAGDEAGEGQCHGQEGSAPVLIVENHPGIIYARLPFGSHETSPIRWLGEPAPATRVGNGISFRTNSAE